MIYIDYDQLCKTRAISTFSDHFHHFGSFKRFFKRKEMRAFDLIKINWKVFFHKGKPRQLAFFGVSSADIGGRNLKFSAKRRQVMRNRPVDLRFNLR